MSIADSIIALLQAIYNLALPFFTAMAGVGIVSMAILQTLKDTTPLRARFQRSRFLSWMVRKAREAKVKDQFLERDLIRLATDGDASAFYDLPVEQMAGQVNLASQIALDYPKIHEHLIRVLASKATEDDLEALLKEPPPSGLPPVRASDSPPDRLQQYIDARNRVAHQIQRAIDSFQISTSFRWKFFLQMAAIALSALIAGIAVPLFTAGAVGDGRIVGLTVATGLLGGFLAPVAHDLVAALQNLKGKALRG